MDLLVARTVWTCIRRIAGKDVPDDLYQRVREQFTEEELVLLTLAVVQINGLNRFAIPFQPEVGSYQLAQDDVAAAPAKPLGVAQRCRNQRAG
jgi:hypothetical protein